uniref:Uncharacterized protein n=1 Tax=Cyprinus carpio TaxID=7962 RepID=A0A8C1LFZ9_CYPCA
MENRESSERSSSADHSCVSLKSDKSNGLPSDLSDDPVTSDPRIFRVRMRTRKRKRSSSPDPSCVSLKSGRSMQYDPPKFNNELVTSDPRLSGCDLSDQHCEIVSSALQSSNCVLRELDLSNNDLQDSGVKFISDGLKSPNCQLQILRLSGCMVSEEGCSYLSSALSSNPSHLRELDLSYNHPGQSGVQLLKHKLQDPNYKLQILNMAHGGEIRMTAGPRKYSQTFKDFKDPWEPCT